jgi:hypothetical protein
VSRNVPQSRLLRYSVMPHDHALARMVMPTTAGSRLRLPRQDTLRPLFDPNSRPAANTAVWRPSHSPRPCRRRPAIAPAASETSTTTKHLLVNRRCGDPRSETPDAVARSEREKLLMLRSRWANCSPSLGCRSYWAVCTRWPGTRRSWTQAVVTRSVGAAAFTDEGDGSGRPADPRRTDPDENSG